MDFIQLTLDECDAAIRESDDAHDPLDAQALSGQFESMTSCITTIRNTHSFMLMTINRCIDFTKASNGMALVPKFESVSLSEALQYPIECMRNMQSRVAVVLEDWPAEFAAESSPFQRLATDKQWLEENMLCLLSNAVKYTSEGRVTVRVSAMTVPVSAAVSPLLLQPQQSQPPLSTASGELLGHTAPTVVNSLSLDLPVTNNNNDIIILNSNNNSSNSNNNNNITSNNTSTSTSGSNRNYLLRSSSMDSLLLLGGGGGAGSSKNNHSHNNNNNNRSRSSSGCPNTNTVQQVRIEVEDAGPGVSESDLLRLFSPSHRQQERLSGGAGLGLYSLFKRMQALRGSCGVCHRKDGRPGAVFWFSLPLTVNTLVNGAGTGNETAGCSVAVQSQSQSRRSLTKCDFPDRLRQEVIPEVQSLDSFDNGNDNDNNDQSLGVLNESNESNDFDDEGSRLARVPTGRRTSHAAVATVAVSDAQLWDGMERCRLRSRSADVTMLRAGRRSNSNTANAVNDSTTVNGDVPKTKKTDHMLSILLVDDSATIIKLTSLMLQRMGHNVHTAENGLVAVNIVREREEMQINPFDLILMDLQMPVMDGLEATRRIRLILDHHHNNISASHNQNEQQQLLLEDDEEAPRRRHRTIIIGMSACSDDETTSQVLAAGATVFIPKPFTAETLKATINGLL
jgi:CheY-like chemotaxis protein/signal transduction histidine kinase